MSIAKRPVAKRGSDAAVDAIIDRAPDAGARSGAETPAPLGATKKARGAKKKAPGEKKEAISLTLHPALLARIDEQAQRLSLSRAAAIALACTRWLDQGGQ